VIREAEPSGVEVQPPALCVDRAGLAALLDVSVRQVDRLDSGGKLPAPLALGRCKRWSVEEVKAWIGAGAPRRSLWASIRRAER